MLGSPVGGEIEHGLLDEGAIVQIAFGRDQLVVQGFAAGHDLAGGRDDDAAAQHGMAVLGAGLGHADHPGTVLVRPGLHGQVTVEHAQVFGLVGERVLGRGVVAEEDHLDALQPHDAVGLGPAAVVADAHAEDAAQGAPHRKAQIADLEIAFFQVLEFPRGVVFGVPGKVHLAVLADDRPRLVDQDRGVVAAHPARLFGQLGIAEAEPQPHGAGRIEQGLGFRARHFPFEPGIDLRLVLHVPPRKEGGQRELGKDDHVTAPGVGPGHEIEHAPDGDGPAVAALNGAQLRRPDGEDPRHLLPIPASKSGPCRPGGVWQQRPDPVDAFLPGGGDRSYDWRARSMHH